MECLHFVTLITFLVKHKYMAFYIPNQHQVKVTDLFYANYYSVMERFLMRTLDHTVISAGHFTSMF